MRFELRDARRNPSPCCAMHACTWQSAGQARPGPEGKPGPRRIKGLGRPGVPALTTAEHWGSGFLTHRPFSCEQGGPGPGGINRPGPGGIKGFLPFWICMHVCEAHHGATPRGWSCGKPFINIMSSSSSSSSSIKFKKKNPSNNNNRNNIVEVIGARVEAHNGTTGRQCCQCCV